MDFEIIGNITGIEPIAVGAGFGIASDCKSYMARGDGESCAVSPLFGLPMVR